MWSVVVQAGGSSKRMGRDKATVLFRGQFLISRVLDRVRELGNEIIVMASDAESYNFLPEKVVKDLIVGYGPLGGLYSAFSVAQNPYVLVVACDMPFLNTKLLREQQRMLIPGNYDVVIPRLEQGLEPLHAAYRRERCLIQVRQAIDAGEKRAVSWLERVSVREFTDQEVRRIDPRMLSFLNVNTPADLQLAEQMDET